MKRLKNKIIDYFKKLLGFDYLNSELNKSYHKINQLSSELKECKDKLDFINSSINIGTSISYNNYDPSWCVIALRGEQKTFIEFYNLKDKDIREIETFLMQFEKSNKIYDVPYNMKNLFYDKKLKNKL